MKITQITNKKRPSRVLEVDGKEEITRSGVDIDTVKRPDEVPEPEPLDSMDVDTGLEYEGISDKVLDFAKKNKFVTDHDHGSEDVSSLLQMTPDQIKNEIKNTKTAITKIELDDDDAGVGLYDNERYNYMVDKLKFLSDLLEIIDEE